MIEGISWSKTEETKQKAHPDTLRNFKYANDALLRHKETVKNVQVAFDGVHKNFNGEFQDPTSISFYWKNKDLKCGITAPLSQPREDFTRWLDNFISEIIKAHPKPIPNPRQLNPDDLF